MGVLLTLQSVKKTIRTLDSCLHSDSSFQDTYTQSSGDHTQDMFHKTAAFVKFKEKLFPAKLKQIKNELKEEEQRPRSSSICSVNTPASEDLVQESIAMGLPIIPFGSSTFVIEDESPQAKSVRENYQSVSDKKLSMDESKVTQKRESVKTMKTNSREFKLHLFGSLDLRKKSSHVRNFTKNEEYMYLDYSRKMNHSQRRKQIVMRDKTLCSLII